MGLRGGGCGDLARDALTAAVACWDGRHFPRSWLHLVLERLGGGCLWIPLRTRAVCHRYFRRFRPKNTRGALWGKNGALHGPAGLFTIRTLGTTSESHLPQRYALHGR